MTYGRCNRHILPLLSCLAVALLLSFLPYVLWIRASVAPAMVYINDPDNAYYVQIAAQAYYNHLWYLSDPALAAAPLYFPWLQFVPAIAASRAAGLGPFGVNLIWHLWAAVGLALGIYFVLREYLRSSWVVAGCTTFLLADIGFDTGHPLISQLLAAVHILSGHLQPLVSNWPPLLQQFRIVDPAIPLPLMLLEIWLLSRARARPNAFRLALAGLAFALLFYAYFFYWTAALGALIIAWILDRDARKVYAHTLWIGCLLGFPAVAHDLLIKHGGPAEGLQRVSYFLPMPRRAGFFLPRIPIALTAISYLWIRHERRTELTYLLSLAIAGLLLNNSEVLTGVDIREGHWQVVWGPAISLLIVILVASWASRHISWRRLATCALWVFLGLYVVTGAWLERFDVMSNLVCTRIRTSYQQYTTQEVRGGDTGFAPRAVIAGDARYVDIAIIANDLRPLYDYAVLMSPNVDNAEWSTRLALNQYLQGMDRAEFRAWATRFSRTYEWGPWSYDPRRRPALAALLIRKYDDVSTRPLEFMKRFGVRYIAVRNGRLLPASIKDRLLLIQNGPIWQIWEKPVSSRVGLKRHTRRALLAHGRRAGGTR